jgi:hypothetical protein
MYKYLLILMLLIGAVVANEEYIDTIESVYTDSIDFSVIETENWQYMYIENIEEVLFFLEDDLSVYEGRDILVKEIKQLNNKTVIAKILIL